MILCEERADLVRHEGSVELLIAAVKNSKEAEEVEKKIRTRGVTAKKVMAVDQEKLEFI